MAGYFLILAIIVLGGVIATVGDRIGSRVGKARLSLFNLRPKKTAVLVTILTGSITAATTLGILLAANRELRDIVFRTDAILRQNRKVNQELNDALSQKSQIQSELSVSRADLIEAVRRLRNVNDSLKVSVQRQKVSEARLKQLSARYGLAQKNLKQFSNQAKTLRSQIAQLSAQRQQLAVQRTQILARLSQADAQKRGLEAATQQARQRIQNVEQQKQQLESAIAQAQQQLRTAERQQAALQKAVVETRTQLDLAAKEQTTLRQQREGLQREIAALEENRQRLAENLERLLLGLRRGNVTIRTGQILARGVVQNLNSREAALQAINALRLEARREAIVLTNPQNLSPDQQVVVMTREDVERLVTQISDGRPYVVRILSAVNYLEGESQVIAVPQVAPNVEVFPQEEIVARLSLTPSTLTDEQLLSRINALFGAVNRQAIEAGMLPDPVSGTVGTFSQIDLFRFVLALKARNDDMPIEVQAVTATKVFSAGPLVVDLVALQNGKQILRS